MRVQADLGLLGVDELTRPLALQGRRELLTQNLQKLSSDDVANSRLDDAYQTVEDYFDPTALEAADQAPYELARAVLGELVVRDLLAQNATTELVNIENMIIDAIKGEPQSGFVRPEITFAPNGVIFPNQTAWIKLPPNVDGAFVAGQHSEPGTILLSDGLKGPDSQESQQVVLEELGEALGAHFEANGFPIAAGDVGHRLMKVFLGKPLKAEDFMINSSGTDAQLIDFKGSKTIAKTAADEVPEETVLEVLPTELKVATLATNTKTPEELAEEWGAEGAAGLFDVNEAIAQANNLQNGPPWTDASYADISDWDLVVANYGTDGTLQINDVAHAIFDGAVELVAVEDDALGNGLIVFDVDESKLPARTDAELAVEWGYGDPSSVPLVTAAREAAATIYERNSLLGESGFSLGDRDTEGWNQMIKIYGQEEAISGIDVPVLQVDEMARAIFEGAVTTTTNSAGEVVFDAVDLSKVSSLALTDAIWLYAGNNTQDGAQRVQIPVKLLQEAVTDITGDADGFPPSDGTGSPPEWEVIQTNYADFDFGDEVPISGVAGPTRFSKDAVLSIWETGGFARDDAASTNILSFSVDEAAAAAAETGVGGIEDIEDIFEDVIEDEEEYLPVDEWAPDPDVDNSGWIASDDDDLYISDDLPADTEMYAQDDLAAWGVLVQAVNEVSRDDSLLTQSDLWDVLQHVGGEAQVTHNYAHNLINIYGDGTHVTKAAVLEHMTMDSFLVPDPDEQNGWMLQWENIDGVDMARGFMNMAGITDYNGTITGKQFSIAFDNMFNPASFTDPDVGVPAAADFAELKDFIFNELQQTFATQSDSTAALLGGVFTIHDIADIFDSATLKVGASADTTDYVVTVDDTAVKAKDEAPVAGFATSDANSDGIIDMSEFVAHTGLPAEEATRMAALYGYSKNLADGTTESFFSKYQLSEMIDEGALVAPAAGAAAWTTDLNQVNNLRLVDAIFKHFGKTAGNDNLTAEQLAEGIEAATGVALADPAHADYLADVFGRSSPVDETTQIVNGDDVLDMFSDGEFATATLLRDFANIPGDTTINYEDLTNMSGEEYRNAHWWDTVIGAGQKFGEGIGHYVTSFFNAVAETNQPFGESDVAALLNGRDLQEPAVATAWDVILEEARAGNTDVHAAIDDLFNLHAAYLADEEGGGLSAAEMAWFMQMGDKASTGDAMAIETLFKFTAMSRETLRTAVLRIYEQGLFTDGVANLTFGEIKEAIPNFDELYTLAEEYKEFQIDAYMETGFVWDTVLDSVGGDAADAADRLSREGLAVGEGGAIVTLAGDSADDSVERSFYAEHMRFEFVAASEIDIDFQAAFNNHEFHQFKPYMTVSLPRESETGELEVGFKIGLKDTVGSIGVTNGIALKTGPGTSNDTIFTFLSGVTGRPDLGTPATKISFRNSLTFMGLAHAKATNVNWSNLAGATSDFFQLLASYKPAWLPGDTTIPPSFIPPPNPDGPPGIFSTWPSTNLQAGVGYGISHTYDVAALGEDAWMPYAISLAGSAAGAGLGLGIVNGFEGSPKLGLHLGGQVGSILSHIAFSEAFINADATASEPPVKRTHGAYAWGLVQGSTPKGEMPPSIGGTQMLKASFQGTMFQSPNVSEIG